MQKPTGRTGRCQGAAVICLGLITSGASPVFAAQQIQVGRYETLQPVPTVQQTDLLTAPVSVRFPESVATVGQAVAYLLQVSGYRLSDSTTADPARVVVLTLPLPEVHRTLGPMALRVALETLAGPALSLVEDPLHRLVSFERCGLAQTRLVTPTPAQTR